MSGEWTGQGFGAFIKHAREAANMSQDVLGAALGRSKTFVMDMERGRTHPSDKDRLRLIADTLNLDMGDLYASLLVSRHRLQAAGRLHDVQLAAEMLLARDSISRKRMACEIRRVPPLVMQDVAAEAASFCKSAVEPQAMEMPSAVPICSIMERVSQQGTIELAFTSPEAAQSVVAFEQGKGIVVEIRRDLWSRAQAGHPRARMACAHALAHAILHTQALTNGVHGSRFVDADVIGTKFDKLDVMPYQCPEIQANIWAQHVLVPPQAIAAALRQYEGFDNAPIAELATRFVVTASAMQERIERYLAT